MFSVLPVDVPSCHTKPPHNPYTVTGVKIVTVLLQASSVVSQSASPPVILTNPLNTGVPLTVTVLLFAVAAPAVPLAALDSA